MNYYEELGLSPSATAEEIRQAYKTLARLLHPDQQREETLRRLAECQMKRWNGICDLLTDPDARRVYDRELLEVLPRGLIYPPEPAPERRPRSTNWIWLAAAAVGTVTLAAYFVSEAAADRRVMKAAAPAAIVAVEPRNQPATPAPPPVAHPSARKTQTLRIPAVAPAPPERALPEPPEVASAGGRLAESGLETAKLETAVTPPPAPPPQPTYAGTWFYAQSKMAELSALYLPEYIEAVIVEEAGVLRGRYRARYKVADRAISPDVRFQFSGPADSEAPRLAWTGGGGAKGEVRLKLLSSNSLEVDWTASRLGASLGLSSGTAVLTRRQEP
ncbi:MAG: J domain-containing protein [Bryobacteraceae bacterium]